MHPTPQQQGKSEEHKVKQVSSKSDRLDDIIDNMVLNKKEKIIAMFHESKQFVAEIGTRRSELPAISSGGKMPAAPKIPSPNEADESFGSLCAKQ